MAAQLYTIDIENHSQSAGNLVVKVLSTSGITNFYYLPSPTSLANPVIYDFPVVGTNIWFAFSTAPLTTVASLPVSLLSAGCTVKIHGFNNTNTWQWTVVNRTDRIGRGADADRMTNLIASLGTVQTNTAQIWTYSALTHTNTFRDQQWTQSELVSSWYFFGTACFFLFFVLVFKGRLR